MVDGGWCVNDWAGLPAFLHLQKHSVIPPQGGTQESFNGIGVGNYASHTPLAIQQRHRMCG